MPDSNQLGLLAWVKSNCKFAQMALPGPRDPEAGILYETANLYCVKTRAGFEIRLNGATHSVVVGTQPTLEKAKMTMDRLELHPENLRQFMQHR